MSKVVKALFKKNQRYSGVLRPSLLTNARTQAWLDNKTSAHQEPQHRPGTKNRFTYFESTKTDETTGETVVKRGSMLTLATPEGAREWAKDQKRAGRRLGLVPTMGALHQGHLDLVRKAAEECDAVVVSIYVNPTQFGANEDLSSYPRPFRQDLKQLDSLNASLTATGSFRGRVRAVFNPFSDDMYPFGHESASRLIIDPALTQKLEGKTRPTFFQGVTTVVMKLLNIVQPDAVYFGQKDVQQLIVIRRMINEFHMPTTLRAVATTRERDGLAMSSRNVYLGQRRRHMAHTLNHILRAGTRAVAQYDDQDVPRKVFLDAVVDEAVALQKEQQALPPKDRVRFELDYISLADPIHLNEIDVMDRNIGAVASGALIMLPLEDVQEHEILGLGGDMGSVRLIDNIAIGNAARLFGTTQSSFRKVDGTRDGRDDHRAPRTRTGSDGSKSRELVSEEVAEPEFSRPESAAEQEADTPHPDVTSSQKAAER